jgi:hypothetical protein
MLAGHDTSAFLALLAPTAAKDIKTWFDGTSFSTIATWIDPGARLDPAEEVRVSGRVTFDSAVVGDIRTLRITTNFVWVYAFSGNPSNPLAVAHDEIRWDFPATARLRNADKGMWIGDADGYLAWIDCAAAHKGMLAPTKASATPNPTESEDPNAYLRPNHTLAIADDCGPSPSPSAG